MNRKLLFGLGLIAGAVGLLVLARQQLGTAIARVAGQAEPPPAKQWPFDRQELQALMDRTIAEQRTIIASAETPEERARAEAFRKYYEGRRAAVAEV